MPLKNTVAAERRMDLASLFCMIGRHGPAVALAVIAMVSVLAGFIIYRNVRGKRRKAAAADGDGDGKCPGEERDASVMQPSSEESHSSAESTDVSDEGSSDVKEDDDLIKSDLEIRHRRVAAAAAAEKKPPPSPPISDIQVPESQHTTSDDTEETAVVCDSSEVAEMCEEEANQGLSSVAELVVEDAVDCHQGATADTVQDFIEEVRVNDSCSREPEPIIDDNHEEEEKEMKAERQKDEDVDTERDVSDKKTRPEEENFQSASNNRVGFEQTPQMGDKGDNDRLQDNQTPLQENSESNSEESVIHIEDVTAPGICYGEDAEFKTENIDSFDDSGYTGNDLSPEEDEKNDSEKAEEECVHIQVISQQAEIMPITCEQETNLPSTQQNQCDHVVNSVVLPTRDSNLDEDDVLAGEVTEEIVDEDQLNKLTPVIFDTHSPQFEQETATELKKETGLTPDQEDFVLCDGTDQMKKKMLSSDNIVASSQENESSNVVLPCFSEAVEVDNSEDSLSDINTDVEAQISGTADFLDLSSVCPSKKEDKIAPSLDLDTDFTVTGPQMLSQETEDLPEDNRNDRIGVLSEECRDQVYDPHAQSCYKDEQNVQMIDAEVSDKASVAVDTNAAQNAAASVKTEEISHMPSICQEQQNESIKNNDTLDQMRVNSATDAADCNNASLSAFVMSEDISHPDMSSSIQDQQSDHMENDKDFTEVTTVTAPDMTHDNMTQETSRPMCHIYLPSFEANEQRNDDISSPGDGEESGISSMVVSPDLQDAGNEFEVTTGNMVLPVRDCDLQSDEQTEAQNSLLADDVTISVISEDTAAMVFEPYLSSCSKEPCSEHTDGIKYESYAANEDMFGHEIEDGYHKALDQFTAQIAASMTTHTDDPKIQPDIEAVVEVVEIKKDTAVSVKQKGNTKAEKEKEKEEDYEKTEISIMEATMDNNEWITDSNYQVLPWLNVSSPSFAQDHTKTKQVPTDEYQSSSAVTDDTCVVTTDISPEVNQTSPTPLVDENMETNKKVVAVQPMPQNVNVTFRVHYFTQSPYQTVAVTGNQEELGNWKGFVPLERSKDGHWVTVVSLPVESHVEWKFVVVDKGEVCRWEECGNRLLDTGYGDDLLVHKWWGLL